jgi:adenosylcobinamide-phosphate synthase
MPDGGALGVQLGGPRAYQGEFGDDAWIGTGRADATAADIRRALRLYRTACALQIAVYGALVLVSARV